MIAFDYSTSEVNDVQVNDWNQAPVEDETEKVEDPIEEPDAKRRKTQLVHLRRTQRSTPNKDIQALSGSSAPPRVGASSLSWMDICSSTNDSWCRVIWIRGYFQEYRWSFT